MTRLTQTVERMAAIQQPPAANVGPVVEEDPDFNWHGLRSPLDATFPLPNAGVVQRNRGRTLREAPGRPHYWKRCSRGPVCSRRLIRLGGHEPRVANASVSAHKPLRHRSHTWVANRHRGYSSFHQLTSMLPPSGSTAGTSTAEAKSTASTGRR